MGLDQGQGQLGQFADQLFEAAVFLSPLFNLREQIHRDVNGMSFGFELPSEVVARVLVAAGTAAVGIATGATDSDEAGGQDRAFGLELLLTGLKEAADQGGVFRYFHAFTRAILRPGQLNSIMTYQLQAQKDALRQLFPGKEHRHQPVGGAAQPTADGRTSSRRPQCHGITGEISSPALGPAGRRSRPEATMAPCDGAKSSYVTGLPTRKCA